MSSPRGTRRPRPSRDRDSFIKAADPLLLPPASVVARVLSSYTRHSSARPLVTRPGGMGDLILLTLAMRLSGHDPRDFDWLIERRSASWAEFLGLPAILWDGRRFLDGLVRRRHELVICSEQRYGLALAASRAMLAPGGRLVAFGSNRGSNSAGTRVPYDPGNTHEVDSFGQLLAAALGTPWLGATRTVREVPADGPPTLAIAGTGAYARDLQLADWHLIIEMLLPEGDFVVSASPADLDLAKTLISRVGHRAHLVAGFPEAVRTIARAQRLVTVDGGMVHVASYLGVPTDVLFTAGRDEKWGPLAVGSRVWARRDLPCRPCTTFGQTPPCPNLLACRDVREVLAQPSIEPRS